MKPIAFYKLWPRPEFNRGGDRGVAQAVEAEAEPIVSISIEAGVSIIGGESSDPEARHWGEVIRHSLGGEAGQGSRNSLMKKDEK